MRWRGLDSSRSKLAQEDETTLTASSRSPVRPMKRMPAISSVRHSAAKFSGVGRCLPISKSAIVERLIQAFEASSVCDHPSKARAAHSWAFVGDCRGSAILQLAFSE